MINIANAFGTAPKYALEVADTIIEFNGKPHRTIKMRITGSTFEHKDTGMFVRTRNGFKTEECWMAEIAEQDQAVYGYFPIDFMPGDVEFGYADKIIAVFKKAKWDRLLRLENNLIEKGVATIDHRWLKQQRQEKKKGL